jgi:uncharacterized membrane protein YeaQ/YmgE (transglycosylase-associated protein family)
MLSVVVWIAIGAVIGWVASRVMGTGGAQDVGANIVIGIVGAALAGFVLSPMFGLPTLNQDVFHLGSLLLSLIGAVILVAAAGLLRRGR